MKKHSAFILLILLVAAANSACAQTWFQSGAAGGGDSSSNYGASVSIQSIYQNVTEGSLGFWVGETLDNGAFIQAGYEIVNDSARYPSYCTPSGCSGYTYLEAGVPTWFWEYFPAGASQSAFYGGVGGDASAGTNGTFNTYSFRFSGNTWNFYFNYEQVGSVNLGTSYSGGNSPSAIGEIADTNSNRFVMDVVRFKDLEFYDGNSFKQLPSAYATIDYGVGSEKALLNSYGVEEIGQSVNYFEVGSGLPTQDGQLLWKFGYALKISSTYGNITSSSNYSAYVQVPLSAPKVINLSASTREVFVGWKGNGIGAYTGNASTTYVIMDGNMQETALWQRQYYLGVNGTYGSIRGAGWYNSNSTATLQVLNSTVNVASGTRVVFSRWGNGVRTSSTVVPM